MSTDQKSTKKCPFCAEEIKAEAIFCRFCNHDLKRDEEIKAEVEARALFIDKRKKVGKSMLKQVIIGGIIFLFGAILSLKGCSNTNSDIGSMQFSFGFLFILIGLIFIIVARARMWWHGS